MNLIMPEIVAIGIYNSNVAVKNKTVTNNRKTTMFEIELPIENGGISYVNDEEALIEPITLICAKPGNIRHTKLPFKCYYIHFMLTSGELYDNLISLPSFIKTNKYDKYCEIFKNLCKYYDTAIDTDEIIIHSLILELIHLLLNDARRADISNHATENNHRAISNAINYIKNNLTADLSLEAISALIGFSPIYFHNLFKASTGRTLHEYVEEQRIRKAANMLITTDFTLAKIAYECGFSSQSYFSYAFKRKMNKTPREYAKEVFERYEEPAQDLI